MGLKRIILNRFSVRMHLLIILAGTYAAGALFGRLLLALGITSIPGRFALVAPVSYGVFFVLVGVWIDYVRSGLAQHQGMDAGDEQPQGEKPQGEKPQGERPKKSRGSAWDWLDAFNLDEFVIVVLCLVAVVSLGAWVLVDGPLILVDAAFEALIAAGFARSARKMLDSDWKGTVFSRTIGPFFLIWIVGAISLMFLDSACPGRAKLSEAIRQCGK